MAKQYKVLTTSNKIFGSKFDPNKVEEIINSYARVGWVVISITSADKGANTGFNKSIRMQELIIVMEADV